jgi:hypothetical protein
MILLELTHFKEKGLGIGVFGGGGGGGAHPPPPKHPNSRLSPVELRSSYL